MRSLLALSANPLFCSHPSLDSHLHVLPIQTHSQVVFSGLGIADTAPAMVGLGGPAVELRGGGNKPGGKMFGRHGKRKRGKKGGGFTAGCRPACWTGTDANHVQR